MLITVKFLWEKNKTVVKLYSFYPPHFFLYFKTTHLRPCSSLQLLRALLSEKVNNRLWTSRHLSWPISRSRCLAHRWYEGGGSTLSAGHQILYVGQKEAQCCEAAICLWINICPWHMHKSGKWGHRRLYAEWDLFKCHHLFRQCKSVALVPWHTY